MPRPGMGKRAAKALVRERTGKLTWGDLKLAVAASRGACATCRINKEIPREMTLDIFDDVIKKHDSKEKVKLTKHLLMAVNVVRECGLL